MFKFSNACRSRATSNARRLSDESLPFSLSLFFFFRVSKLAAPGERAFSSKLLDEPMGINRDWGGRKVVVPLRRCFRTRGMKSGSKSFDRDFCEACDKLRAKNIFKLRRSAQSGRLGNTFLRLCSKYFKRVDVFFFFSGVLLSRRCLIYLYSFEYTSLIGVA